MQINNDILYDYIHCPYKAYRKSKHQIGILTNYQMFHNQLKQTQKENFEKNQSVNSQMFLTNKAFDSVPPNEGVALNLNFKNANIDMTLDGF